MSICRPYSLRITSEAEAASNWPSQPVVRVSETVAAHIRPTPVQSRCVLALTEQSGHRVPTKKLFTIESCWERASQFSPMVSPQVWQAHHRQDPCPGTVENAKQTFFLSSSVNFLLPFILTFFFFFLVFCLFWFSIFMVFWLILEGFGLTLCYEREKDHKVECIGRWRTFGRN